jgi:hypothetical protein
MNTLNFLKDYDKSLNDLAEEIENIIYNHPNSSATKMRIFIETLIKKIIKIENLNSYKYSKLRLYEKIAVLNKKYLEDLGFKIGEDGKPSTYLGVKDLINNTIFRRDYKIYVGGGLDNNNEQIKKYDVVYDIENPSNSEYEKFRVIF